MEKAEIKRIGGLYRYRLFGKGRQNMDRLGYFASYAHDAKTPKELYEAIEKLGPLPRYRIVGVNERQEDDIHEKDPAVEDAKAIYAHAREIAIRLRESKPDLPLLPPIEPDPFLGLQTIQEWCIEAEKTTKLAETDSRQGKFGFHPKETGE